MSAGIQLITADIVVPMTRETEVLVDAGVAIDGDTIVAVDDISALRARFPGASERHLADHVLLPGLINGHHHSGLLRGTAEHLPVWEWLRLHIDPMHRVLEPDDAEAAARLCYAEGLLSGTTTVVDMWRYMDRAAAVATELGNRLVTVNYVGEHPDYDYFDTLDDNERVLREWTGAAGGRIMPWVDSSIRSTPTRRASSARSRWQRTSTPGSTPTAASPNGTSRSSTSAWACGRCTHWRSWDSSIRRGP